MPFSMMAVTTMKDSIIDGVFSYTDRHKLTLGRFESSVYIKFSMHTIRKNALIRLVPNIFRMEKGSHSYIGESSFKYNYTYPGVIDKKEIAFYSTMPYMREFRDNVLNNMNVTIYEANLLRDRFLSPMNEKNRSYYHYRLDSTYAQGEETYYLIRIRPRFHNPQLVKGYMVVRKSSGGVDHCMLESRYDLTRVKLTVKMGLSGMESLLPVSAYLNFYFPFFRNLMDAHLHAQINYNKIEPLTDEIKRKAEKANRYDLSYLNSLNRDTASILRSIHYFNQNRPYPLLQKEKRLYASYDSMLIKSGTLEDSLYMPSPTVYDKMEDALLSSHSLDFRNGSFNLPPVLTPSMFQWSGSRGLTLQTKLGLDFNTKHDQEFRAGVRLGYNFKEEKFYWKVPISYTFSPGLLGRIDFEVGNGNDIYSSVQAEEIREALKNIQNYDTLLYIFDSFNFNYYKDFYTTLGFSIEPINGLQLNTGVTYHRRSLINWNELANKTGLERVYNSLASRLHIDWTPGYFYYLQGKRKIPLYSHWPTFSVDYERGIQIKNRKNNYQRWEFDIKYKLKLYALRALYFRLGGGFYSQYKTLYFVDFANFNYNYMPNGWDDEMSGQFQLLDSRWYNESNYYARFCTAYESPMLFFSRFKYLSNYIQKERVYCNILMVHALTPYVEFGYGLSTHVFDMGVFGSAANGTGFSFGAKVALRLFDKW